MKNINNSDMEKMLLTGKSLDELIQIKIQEEYKAIRESKPVELQKVNEISKLSENEIFSKNAVFKVFNKNTRCESFINGVQAEAMLGMQEDARKSIISGKIDAFVANDCYVEFMYAQTQV